MTSRTATSGMKCSWKVCARAELLACIAYGVRSVVYMHTLLFFSGRILQKIKDGIDVVHLMFNSGRWEVMMDLVVCVSSVRHIYTCSFMISNRDMVFWRATTVDSDGTVWVLAKSVVHPDCPEGFKKCVRATIHVSGYKLEPITLKDGRAGIRATYIMQIDLNGMLPAFAVNHVRFAYFCHAVSRLFFSCAVRSGGLFCEWATVPSSH